MSNSGMSAERREGMDGPVPSDDGRDELRSILDTISAQLEDADQRHMAALSAMHERISQMGREADSLRGRIPNQFAPAFEKIEAGIGELAHRLSDPVRGANNRAPPLAHEGAADPFDPWDETSANALAGAYEASGYAAAETASNEPGADRTSAISNINEAWLDSRFAEIARGIEYSLAHVKPENEIADLSQRLAQFEREFAKLFAGVATHDDLSAVRQIEAHLEVVVHGLERTNGQLDRLNAIEAQLASVSKTLAEMRAAPKGAPTDIEAVARAVAEETAQRFAAKPTNSANPPADELRPLIEQLRTENRQGGEQTAALLDTMQQAMVRLLDRIDGIEFTHSGPINFDVDRPAQYSANTGIFGSDFGFNEDLASDRDGGVADDARAGAPPIAPPFFAGGDASLPSEEMAAKSEKLRQEFVADARRAKMRLSGEGDYPEAPLAPAMAAPHSQASIVRPAGSRPIRHPKHNAKKNASGPSAPSPKLMLVAALVLIALAGLWYIFGFGNKPSHVAASDAPQSVTSQNKTEETNGAAEAQKDTSAPSEVRADASMPSGQPGEANGTGAPDANGSRGDLAPSGGNRTAASASPVQSEPKTTLPMIGVAVDLNHPMTEAELERARRHQAMANISGELGNAAARPADRTSVPASMIPSEAETEGTAPEQQAAVAQPGQKSPPADVPAQKSSPLDMPSAMIGPLSLRLAAANGDSSAQFEVGARFAEGSGVKQNFVEAAKWYQRSADQGFAQAQYRLGTLYERGLGLKPDRGQATTWYLRAAEQGNIKAMHNLAVLSANQTDRSPDYSAAAQWFTEAAKRGLPDSQFNLAILYENGLGVTRDMKQAFLWLSLAAQGGDEDAIHRREILRGKLTAQELAQTEKMLAAWQITPSDRTVNDALTAGELWKKNPKNGTNG
jgi:localization factor PodJL